MFHAVPPKTNKEFRVTTIIAPIREVNMHFGLLLVQIKIANGNAGMSAMQ